MYKNKFYQTTIHLFAIIGLFFVGSFIAIKLGFTKEKGKVDSLNRYLTSSTSTNPINTSNSKTWSQSEEYKSFRESVIKDAPLINKAADVAGINSRLIVSALIAEQMRLYVDNRESFKKFFEPLKILGIQSQFSWGVMGMKRETAIQIENNLKDVNSPYYLGPEYEHLLDFKTEDKETERFDRIIEKHNQYYSYLYAGLFMKQIEKQWKDAGFPVDNRPEVMTTLYNIGFSHSSPNDNPKPGGAEIKVGDIFYSFGGLGYEFYNSSELMEYFPKG